MLLSSVNSGTFYAVSYWVSVEQKVLNILIKILCKIFKCEEGALIF